MTILLGAKVPPLPPARDPMQIAETVLDSLGNGWDLQPQDVHAIVDHRQPYGSSRVEAALLVLARSLLKLQSQPRGVLVELPTPPAPRADPEAETRWKLSAARWKKYASGLENKLAKSEVREKQLGAELRLIKAKLVRVETALAEKLGSDRKISDRDIDDLVSDTLAKIGASSEAAKIERRPFGVRELRPIIERAVRLAFQGVTA